MSEEWLLAAPPIVDIRDTIVETTIELTPGAEYHLPAATPEQLAAQDQFFTQREQESEHVVQALALWGSVVLARDLIVDRLLSAEEREEEEKKRQLGLRGEGEEPR